MLEDAREIARQTIMGIKPYTPGKPIEEVQRELGLTDVVKMASNENLIGPSPRALAAIREAAASSNYYPDAAHYLLKKALAAKCGVPEECLIVGNGSDEIIKLIAEAFLNPGEEVVMGDPSFLEYEFAARLMGGTPVMVPLKEYTHDLEAMAAAISDKTKLVFVCNPNNPTGTLVGRDEIDRFLSGVPDRVLVVLDHAYAEYVTREDYTDGIEYVTAGKNVITLRTFSKVYGLAGLRVGYGIARKDIIECIQRTREPFNVNALAQAAAIASLEDEEHVIRSREVNEEGKKYLYSALGQMGLEYVPTYTNFMLINVGTDSRRLFQEMLKEGVIVRTGDIFGLPGYIRVTIGLEEHNRRLIEALKKVLARV